MPDPDSASRRPASGPLRLAVPAPREDAPRQIAPPGLEAGAGAPPGLAAPLMTILEALAGEALDRSAAAATLVERLGDERMLGLLAQGDTAKGVALRVAQCARIAGEDVRRSLAEHPDDAQGRLARVRAVGALRFGEVLLAQGLVAPRRLEAALESQRASTRRIGEELVAQGQIAAREVAEALWLQHKLVAAALALASLPRQRDLGGPRLVHTRP